MNREPSNTGYVRALHSVTIPDSRGKYGYFCYPIDNRDGEFTWMPVEIKTTVTIYYPDNSQQNGDFVDINDDKKYSDDNGHNPIIRWNMTIQIEFND